MTRSHKVNLAILLIAFLGIQVGTAGGTPHRYVVVNLHWREVNESVFAQICRLRSGQSSESIRLGAARIFSYFQQPHERTRAHLERFLQLSEKYELPVVVQLDGENWWCARPDLWNWWDATWPGYNPDNRMHVEWSGWGPEHAIRIAWRNWGHQLRVFPPPNLMSLRYRDACEEEMRRLIPLVLDWWRNLPAEKKHLFIGIKVGCESSIGTNSFYYPGGNELADRPLEEDPTYGLKLTELPGRGVTPIGYAAVRTAGLAESGELQEEHLVEVVRRHLEGLCRVAAKLGVPRDHLFAHAGGWKDDELLYNAAVNRYSCPGWSFYQHARNPAADNGVSRALKRSDAPFWGAIEWFPMGAQTEQDWRCAIHHTLDYSQCRYLCIYNWNQIKENAAALQAIRSVLREQQKHTGCKKDVEDP